MLLWIHRWKPADSPSVYFYNVDLFCSECSRPSCLRSKWFHWRFLSHKQNKKLVVFLEVSLLQWLFVRQQGFLFFPASCLDFLRERVEMQTCGLKWLLHPLCSYPGYVSSPLVKLTLPRGTLACSSPAFATSFKNVSFRRRVALQWDVIPAVLKSPPS